MNSSIFFQIYIILIICLPKKKGKIKIIQNIIEDYKTTFGDIYMEIKIDNNKYIKELNQSNFKDEIQLYNYAIINFYNENSEISVDFMNDLGKMVNEVREEENSPFGFFKVNEESNPELLKYNKNMDSLFMLVYIKGNIEPYKGIFNTNKIRRFLNRTIEGPLFELNTINDIYKFQKKFNISFLYISTINKNTFEYDLLKDFSEKVFKFSDFIICNSKECKKKFGNDTLIVIEKEKNNKITCLKNYTYNHILKTTNIFQYENLINFTINLGIDNGGILTPLAFEIIKSFNLTTVIFFRNEINETLENNFNEVFQKYKNEYIFLKTKTKGNYFLQEIKIYFVVCDNELPTYQIYESKNQQNFQIKTNNLTKENIEKFISDVKKGKIEREINSELPQENQPEYLSYIKIVGKNFKKLVLESEKPIIVLFFKNNTLIYPKCVKALSNFIYLSRKYIIDYNNKNFQMGIFDVLINEINRNLKKIPFISFYNAPGNLSPIDFDGEPTKENYELFIAKTLGWIEIPKDFEYTYYYEDE